MIFPQLGQILPFIVNKTKYWFVSKQSVDPAGELKTSPFSQT